MMAMHAIRAVAVLAAMAIGGTAWAAAPSGKAQDEAKPRAKAVAKKPVKKTAKQAARKAAPARNARAAAPKVAAPARKARPAVAAARSPATRAPVAPREPHWTQLPPSRFYPNGIPELRPEFLYPLPQPQPPQEARASTSHVTAGHPEVAP
jgi:hypothetical protein